MTSRPVSVVALDQPPRAKTPNYPEPFASLMSKRIKRPLGDLFGLTNFGVNLTVLQPGCASSLRHWHSKQDEFVYIVSGRATLHTNEGATEMDAGACAGFKAGNGNAHRLENRSGLPVVDLEIGDRTAGDRVTYPDDELAIEVVGFKPRLSFTRAANLTDVMRSTSHRRPVPDLMQLQEPHAGTARSINTIPQRQDGR